MVATRMNAAGTRCPGARAFPWDSAAAMSELFAIPLPVAACLLVVLSTGCGEGPGGREALVIWTTWDRARCDEVERVWKASRGPGPFARPVWVPIAEDSLIRRLSNDHRVDLLLGGSPRLFESLASADLLRPPEDPGARSWQQVAITPVGVLAASGTREAPESWGRLQGTPARPLVLDDPRTDRATRCWVEARLGAATWSDGYAEIARVAATAVSAGWPAVDDGTAGRIGMVGRDAPTPLIHFIEGGAVPRSSRRAEEAIRLLATLAAESTEIEALVMDPLVSELTAELVGATLIDAHDDLRSSWRRLEAAGRIEATAARLLQPPPWPPTSVLLLNEDPARADDLDALATELAPSLEARAWLRTSWDVARRPIDGAFLAELASVDGGGLARSAGFRAWLRGEWAAWAGQWYRWVGRGGGQGVEAPR